MVHRETKVCSEHLSFTVKTSSATGFDRTGRGNLGRTVALVTTDAKRVFAMVERPFITPDDPRQVRQRCAQRGFLPGPVINLQFHLRDPTRTTVSDTADGN